MKNTIKVIGLSSVVWVAAPLFGQGQGGNGTQTQNQAQDQTQSQVQVQEQVQTQTQVQLQNTTPEEIQQRTQEQMLNQMGTQAGDLMQLRLRYREQTMLLLKERQKLIQQYRNASEEEQAQIRERLWAQQQTIAEAHRELRAQIREQVREIRAQHQEQNRNQNPGG
jgi:hypothetical protein